MRDIWCCINSIVELSTLLKTADDRMVLLCRVSGLVYFSFLYELPKHDFRSLITDNDHRIRSRF